MLLESNPYILFFQYAEIVLVILFTVTQDLHVLVSQSHFTWVSIYVVFINNTLKYM